MRCLTCSISPGVAACWRSWPSQPPRSPLHRPGAQQVVVLVNGDPITAFDIEQRTKLTQLTANKTPSRQEVIDELIDEKLKLQLLKRYSIEGMDSKSTAPSPTWRGARG